MVEHTKKSSGYGYIFLAIACNMLWGSAIPCINIGYRLFAIPAGSTSSQLLFAGLRFFFAGVMTLLIRGAVSRRLPVLEGGQWSKAFRLSWFQTVGQYVFFYIGVANTLSVKASIIQGLGAFVSILVACFLFRYEKMTWRKWLGGLLGFAGVALVSLKGQGFSLGGGMSFLGEGFLMLSMLSSAISSGLIKKYGQDCDPVLLSGWQFVIGGAMLAIAGWATGGRMQAQSAGAYAILGYLAFLSAAAYSLWSLLLKRHPVSRVAVFMFLQPVFGVLLGVLFVRQELNMPAYQLAVSLALICLSIFLVNRAEKA